MRGVDNETASLFSYVSCEARVPAAHPRSSIHENIDVAEQFADRLVAWFAVAAIVLAFEYPSRKHPGDIGEIEPAETEHFVALDRIEADGIE